MFAYEFNKYFSKFGKVVEHRIMQDHSTGRSPGFGFVTFDSEQVVEEILSHSNMYELGGKQVSLLHCMSSSSHGLQLFIAFFYFCCATSGYSCVSGYS